MVGIALGDDEGNKRRELEVMRAVVQGDLWLREMLISHVESDFGHV